MNKNLAAVFLFASLLALNTVRAEEEVPRRLCVFTDIATEETMKYIPGEGRLKDIDKITKGIRQIGGVTFDIKDKVVVLKKGERIEAGLKRLRYAGKEGIESQFDHDRGPLVFYKIEAMYLLHTVVGSPKDKTLGKWIFGYKDGSSEEVEIRLGENIGSKDIKAEWAKRAGNGLYVTEVTNPYPDKHIKDIRIEIGYDAEYVLVAVTCQLGREPPHTY